EFVVSSDDDVALTTILGSGVAACMRDPLARVGGMNHFLLPGALAGEDLEPGVHAMELLLNALLRAGAKREPLVVRLFGGVRMMKNLSAIGSKNAALASSFLRQEGIACLGDSLGGEQARRIRYWPVSGKAKQMLVGQTDVFAREMKVAVAPVAPPPSDDV